MSSAYSLLSFIPVAMHLEEAGLVWFPEIGDEITSRSVGARGGGSEVSILVDPQGLTPSQLREQFLWLPSVEQLISQFEARNGILLHAGLELQPTRLCYKTVVQFPTGAIEREADSIRTSLGLALRDLLLLSRTDLELQ